MNTETNYEILKWTKFALFMLNFDPDPNPNAFGFGSGAERSRIRIGLKNRIRIRIKSFGSPTLDISTHSRSM